MDFAQYFTDILGAIVGNQDALRVTESKDEIGILVSISVAQEDMGRIIGKQGAMANALRTLAQSVGMNHRARVAIKILEPNGRVYKG